MQRGAAKAGIGLVLREIIVAAAIQRQISGSLPVLAGRLGLVLRDALQPDFTPIGIDRARAEAPADRVARLADDVLEDDRIGLEADHLARGLINDLLLAALDLVLPLGERHHL